MGLEIISGVERRRRWSVSDTDGGRRCGDYRGAANGGGIVPTAICLSVLDARPNEINNLPGISVRFFMKFQWLISG